MKNLFQVLIALFIASVLTACGGEQKSTSVSASVASDSAELIIDNGRGTVNGSDTERPR